MDILDKKPKYWGNTGFTLIELLVVIAIIGIIATTAILLNVHSYFDRANDAKRRHDLGQIGTAAELYHADHNYYPPTISFGSPLTENGAVYMAKVPQDPDCSTGSHPCYLYVADQTNPSQPSWFVAYGKLAIPQTTGASSCTLPCTPPAPTGYDICVYGGPVDCSAITTISPVPSGPTSTTAPLPTDTPIPTTTPVPTFTPTPTPALITLDHTSSTHNSTATSTLSWSHTTSVHPNTILIVSAILSSNKKSTPSYTIGSITYNGAHLTKLSSLMGQFYEIEYWYLTNPSNGNNLPITMTVNGGQAQIAAGGVTYYNVNLSTPFSNLTTAFQPSGVTNTVSLTVPSNPNQVVIDTWGNMGDDAAALGSNQSVLWEEETGPSAYSSSKPGGTNNGTSSTMTYNQIGPADDGGPVDKDTFADIGVALNPSN